MENNIWDRLYEAKRKLENNSATVEALLIEPLGYVLHVLPAKYAKLGYPLGKSK